MRKDAVETSSKHPRTFSIGGDRTLCVDVSTAPGTWTLPRARVRLLPGSPTRQLPLGIALSDPLQAFRSDPDPLSIRRSIAKSPNSMRSKLNNANRGVSHR